MKTLQKILGKQVYKVHRHFRAVDKWALKSPLIPFDYNFPLDYNFTSVIQEVADTLGDGDVFTISDDLGMLEPLLKTLPSINIGSAKIEEMFYKGHWYFTIVK